MIVARQKSNTLCNSIKLITIVFGILRLPAKWFIKESAGHSWPRISVFIRQGTQIFIRRCLLFEDALCSQVLPESIIEQTQIVQEIESRLSVCDKLVETIDESLEQSEALRQSILKEAFEGKLLTDAELEARRKESD